MRHLVKARVKQGQHQNLLQAINNKTLGLGSIAGSEYLRDMAHARQLEDGMVAWVEVCYCYTPLEEEPPCWEEYFELVQVKNAHARDQCKDLSGTDYWACNSCDCTQRLEQTMETWGDLFVALLRTAARLPNSALPHSYTINRLRIRHNATFINNNVKTASQTKSSRCAH